MAFCHLVESSEGLVLIDAGSPGKEHEILRHLKRLGRDDLRLILITHAHLDHYGSAAALRRETGALVAIHAADAEPMAKGETRLGSARYWGFFIKLILPWVEKRVGPEPVAADILLADGDDLRQFGLPGRIVHTPGHTPGSCSVIVSDGIAFVGDLVSPMGRPHAALVRARLGGARQEFGRHPGVAPRARIQRTRRASDRRVDLSADSRSLAGRIDDAGSDVTSTAYRELATRLRMTSPFFARICTELRPPPIVPLPLIL